MDNVVYLRVSTERQGDSGLGLEAQRECIRRFLGANPSDKIIAEFVEIESGRNDDRPKLAAALEMCEATGARLVVAKLDRLARSMKTVVRIMESGVNFVAADFPQANTLTIHIIAAIAEYEAKLISERTKAALSAAKARGIKLGRPRPTSTWGKMSPERKYEVKKYNFLEKYAHLLPIVKAMEGKTNIEVAAHLNKEGYKTHKGCKFESIHITRIRTWLIDIAAEQREGYHAVATDE